MIQSHFAGLGAQISALLHYGLQYFNTHIPSYNSLIQTHHLLSSMDALKTQIYQALQTHIMQHTSSPESVRDFLSSFKPKSPLPALQIQTLVLSELKAAHGQAVVFRMMVQDIMETEYYLGAAVSSKPQGSVMSDIIINKYWNYLQDGSLVADEDFEHVIFERESYHCTSVKGETEWVKKALGDAGEINSVVLKVYDKSSLKLGQIVYGVGIIDYSNANQHDAGLPSALEFEELQDPNNHYNSAKIPKINVLRFLSEAQIEKYGFDVNKRLLAQKIPSHEEIRSELLALFRQFCSEKYAQMLLYSLIGTQRYRMFISGENISTLLKLLVPYFLEVRISIPIKTNLFPQKTSYLKESAFQLSQEHTYVLVDFSKMGEGKIQGHEVQNLACLKRLVEDNQLVYKWEIGESAFKVKCSGIIAKGTGIVAPTYYVKDPKIDVQKLQTCVNYLSEEQLSIFRSYLAQCVAGLQEVDLYGEDKQKIEHDFVSERQQPDATISPEDFNRRLILTKLNVCSRGMSLMSHEAYKESKLLLSSQ